MAVTHARPRPSAGRRTGLAVVASVLGLAGFTFVAAESQTQGDFRPAIGLLGALGLVAMVRNPRAVFLVLLVLWASVLTIRPFRVHFGPQSDLGELTAFGLIGVWLVTFLVGRLRCDRFFLVTTGWLLVAVSGGVLEAFNRGGTLHSMLGDIKALLMYALIVPMISAFSTAQHRALLKHWIYGICTLGSCVTLAVVFLHLDVALVSTLPESVGALGVQYAHATRVRPALTSLLVLATLLLLAEILARGWTPRRSAMLGLFLLMHALTFTRSTWIPLALCALLLALFHRTRRAPLRGLRMAVVGSVLAAVILGLAGSGALGTDGVAFSYRLASVVNPAVVKESSYENRADENAAALRALRPHWFTGTGLTQPYGVKGYTYFDNPPRIVAHDNITLHNQYLFVWMQLGVAGLVWLVSLSAAVTTATYRRYRTLAPEEATEALAVGLALLCFGLQGLLQTSIYYPAQILATVCAVVLLAPLAPRPVATVQEP